MVATTTFTLIVITCLEVTCGNGTCGQADNQKITGLPDAATCEQVASGYRKHFTMKTDSATCIPVVSESGT